MGMVHYAVLQRDPETVHEERLRRAFRRVPGVVAVDAENHALAVEVASLPAQIRGFGHIKLRNVEKVAARQARLLELLRNKGRAASAA